jgi:hypothetical protein
MRPIPVHFLKVGHGYSRRAQASAEVVFWQHRTGMSSDRVQRDGAAWLLNNLHRVSPGTG